MNKLIKYSFTFLLLFVVCSASPDPNRFDELNLRLEEFLRANPGLEKKVELSVDGATVSEFLRMISKTNNLNVTIREGVKGNVVNDFSGAMVKDVLIYLCKEFSLDIEFIGNILLFKEFKEPIVIKEPEIREIKVEYNPENKFLTMDLLDEDIMELAKVISSKSGKTVVVYPKARDKKITGFIQNRPFEQALEKIIASNGLIVKKTKDDFFIIDKDIIKRNTTNSRSNNVQGNASSENVNIIVKDNLFSIEANEAAISDVIMLLSNKLNKNHFFYGYPSENITLFVDNMDYDEFLSSILSGTNFTFKKSKDVYLIGERKVEGFRSTELITLKNRSIEKVNEAIPGELIKNLQVSVFNDLNGLVVSGASEEIVELKNFIELIDIVVPVVTIDLIIIETTKSNNMSGGVQTGIGTGPTNTTSSGTTTPGVDVNLSTDAINNLLSTINGFGLSNLGNVTPNFYMNIQALESNQKLKIKSTPKIATLNGEQATLSIGDLQYYLENNNQLVTTGGVNQNLLNTQIYKSVQADLKIEIKPFVSEDEQISLTVNFTQASFTPPIAPTAPPGQTSRSFQSVIRVKNNDLILLGGLEVESKNDAGDGVPFLSRVPVLKWFFGTRTKEKSTSKLHIFISPHVTY